MSHEYTKMIAIAKRLASLSKKKRDILSQRLADEGIDVWQLPIVSECSDNDEKDKDSHSFDQVSFSPQSFSQQRLWFIDQLNPGNPMYNLFSGMRFNGQLNIECLQRSINSILSRHEILRTNIINSEGVGYQRINPYTPMKIDVIDLGEQKTDTDYDIEDANVEEANVKEASVEQNLRDIAKREANKGFDLASDLLFRFLLIKVNDEYHIGFFIIHHIIFDAWSTLNLLRELSQLYQFYLKAADDIDDVAIPLPTLPIQYKDFALWQRRWAESPGYKEQVAYWQQQLAALPEALELSIEKRRQYSSSDDSSLSKDENLQEHIGDEVGLTLPSSLSQNLYQLAQQQGASLYMVMLAVFNVLLRQYSATKDICVGTSIAHRPRMETEKLLGLFVNTLVMRNYVDDTLSFEEFLQNVKKTATDAYRYQDLPFDHLLEVLDVERTDAHASLFRILFVMNNATVGAANDTKLELPGITISHYENPIKIARFDLTLRVSELESDVNQQGRLIRVDIEYDTALFSSASINSILQHYQQLLKQVCSEVTQPLSHFSLLNRQEKIDRLQASAADWQDYSHIDGIQQLFETAVKEYGEEPALVCDNDTLNYRQLNEYANQLAHYLRSQGVTRETRVAIFMERSTSLIVGLLAILKAGGVYVPLDTQWPQQRVLTLLDDSDITFILSESLWQEKLEKLFGKKSERKILYLNKKQGQLEPWNSCLKTNPEKLTLTGDAAYIIYTSGSTGKPKGVVIEHGQLINYSLGIMSRLFPLSSSLTHSFASVSTVAADLGNTAIYGALCFGGCLHLLSSERSFDPDAVAEYMNQHQVDVLKIVPSHLRGLLSASEPQNILPKKLLLLGGEACPLEIVQTVRNLSSKLRIINHYGPTETTIGTLTYEIPQDFSELDIVPVGRPLPNTQAYVLDDNFNICPQGIAGELFISGKGVAREYQQQAELTAQAFVERQLHIDMPSQRFYRTGDRVRYLASGDIEFLGRVDEQVKLRGYRIELGDIRTCLCDQANVSDAVVVIEDTDTNQQLVAYVVVEGDASSVDNLKSQLGEYLPEYMVPQQFVVITAMPVTANGKIDHSALLELKKYTTFKRNITGNEIQAPRDKFPRDELEAKLADIWCEVLNCESVSIADNFFALGGDSILSLQVIAKAKKSGISITPKQLFDEKNVASLAQVAKTVYSDAEEKLLSIWRSVLKQENIDRHDNFFSLGGDSILSLQVVAQARKAGLTLTPKKMFDNQSVAKLARSVEIVGKKNQVSQKNQNKDASVSGRVPLSPIQQWFFAADHPHKNHWNQSIVFALKQKLHIPALQHAIAAVVKHHDQLRGAFSYSGEQWQQNITTWNEEALVEYFCHVDWLTNSDINENTKNDQHRLNQAFLSEVNRWQSRLQLESKKVSENSQAGRLFKIIYFSGDDNIDDRLLIVAHHLLIDGVSWRILLEDLQSLYFHYYNNRSASTAGNVHGTTLSGEVLPTEVLPEKTLSFQAWTNAHVTMAQESNSNWFQKAKTYWANVHEKMSQYEVMVQPHNHNGVLGKTREYRCQFDSMLTNDLLRQAPQAYTTQINDLLLAALYLAFSEQQTRNRVTGQQALYIELEGHGRETIDQDFDVSRTVGWFTSRFPVLLDSPIGYRSSEYSKERYSDESLCLLIKSIKEQLRKIPQQGMTYGVLRYLSDSCKEISAMKAPAISFNYLGQIDSKSQSLLTPIDDFPAMIERHSDSRLSHWLDINASVVDGVLDVHWRVDESIFTHFDIEMLISCYQHALKKIIAHCCNNHHRAFTPSDFPLADISQRQLDALVGQVGYEAIEDIYPLSPVQQGMLFHSLYSSQIGSSSADVDSDNRSAVISGGVYFNQMLFDLFGSLDIDHLYSAWQFVVDRHTILRTGFFSAQLSQPMQLVYRNKKITINTHDWRNFSDRKCDQLREYIIEQDKQEGFDLTVAPLMRVSLIQLGDKHWQVLWSRHHLLLDGWSSARFMQEVMTAYHSYVQKRDLKTNTIFAQKPTPYKDYIAWLCGQSYIQPPPSKKESKNESKKESKTEEFWRDYLAGFNQPTPVPADKRDSFIDDQLETDKQEAVEQINQDWSCHIPTTLCQELKTMAQQYQVTLNSVMQSAWALLLTRYFGNDVVFGVTSAGRSAPLTSIETMLGVFISTLPLRIQIEDSSGLGEFLQKTQSNHASVREFEHTPLTQVQAWSDIDNGVPLFQSLLVFENYFVDVDGQDDKIIDVRVKKSYEPTNYPLVLTIVPNGFDSTECSDNIKRKNELVSKEKLPGIELQFSFSQMDENAIERLAKYYQNILVSMVGATQGTLLSDIDILDSQQLHEQIQHWNDTATDYPRHLCWQDLFVQQVMKTPDAIAASCQGQHLSYRQLDQRSNRLARVIQRQLLGKDNKIVALLDYRGLDLLTMMVAVLKAGAAYLPLDPEYPPSRLAKILSQAKTELMIVGDELSAMADNLAELDEDTELPDRFDSKQKAVIDIKSINDLLMLEDKEGNLPAKTTPDDLAYVIFTSGSTGEPKGVMVEHLGMLNNMYSKIPSLELTGNDVIAQTASQCFDISVWQFLTALIVGARVEIYPNNISQNPQGLLSAVIKDRVTILESVPSFIFALLESTEKKTTDEISLRWLLPTGEALTPQLAREWLQAYPDIPLMNAYGPAECSDDVAFWPIRIPPAANCVHMPIGRPTDNNQLFILDKNLKPLPIGAEGELYVAGAGVGRGYLHDAKRTAEAFIENPFAQVAPVISNVDSNRLYRTGDLACYREDGALIYRGRVDYQVKIRGLRIELGEIEAAINNHDDIEQCVVTDSKDEHNEQRLVAYITRKSMDVNDKSVINEEVNQPIDEQVNENIIEQLRTLLQAQLPRYMVPAAFVVLDNLPLSSNGKVDRKALPAPDWSLYQSRYIAPRNNIEQQLCDIWQNTLGIDRVGIEDNFFDLGGHSLLAARLKNDIENQFETEVSLVDLFSNPTIAQLSVVIVSVEQNFTDDDLDWMGDLMSTMEEPDVENRDLG